jgi:hypothetical protein
MRAVVIALAVLALLAPVRVAAQGAVSGVVRGPAGEPLRSAVVEILQSRDVARSVGVVSDTLGRYAFIPIPAGRQTIRASHVGYRPFQVEVLVPTGMHLEIDIFLELRPVALQPVIVDGVAGRAAADSISNAPVGGPVSVTDAWALGGGPGFSELGLADAARTVFGDDLADPSDVLYVRGAAADLKLVLLDGAPVFAPFHLGGLVDPFEPTSLQSARLFLGGAPARYDGGLSHVLDLQTRRGRPGETSFTGRADLLSTHARLESGIGTRLRFVLTGRNVHGVGTSPWLTALFPYGYRDGLALVDLSTGEKGNLAFTGFSNREMIQVDTLGGRGRNTSWSNQATSLRYTDTFGEDLEAEFTLAWGDFDARLPLGRVSPVVVQGLARHGRAAADFTSRFRLLTVRYGLGVNHQKQSYAAYSQGEAAAEILRRENSGDAAGIYVDGSVQITPGLRFRGGLRADVFSVGLQAAFAPRAALTWMVAENAALTAAAGRYHQYVRSGKLLITVPQPETGDSVQVPAALAVARANHLSVSLHQVMEDGVRLGLEAFFKEYSGIPSDLDASTHASGVDLWVHRPLGRLTGWGGYSMAWMWSALPENDDTSHFSARRFFTTGLAAPFGTAGRFEVRFAYGAGLPYTAIPSPGDIGINPVQGPAHGIGDPPGSGGMSRGAQLADAAMQDPAAEPGRPAPARDPYLRLDLHVSHSWDSRWRGSAVTFTPYLKVLNALDRRETLFYGANPDRDGTPRAVATLPILPVAGFEWRF